VADAGTTLDDFCKFEIRHNKYARHCRDDARFYQYLQWLADTQLAACSELATTLGMQIGLLGDLAVGAVAEGCEVQMNPELYLPEVKIGAPPDPFSAIGQNWGLPVPVPHVLRAQGFAHFINLLQSNMRHVSALRIDHAMALMRLWWCLPGDSRDPRDGVYVYYPLAELMALLRLESQRNQCLIVAEDLGVVPVEFRQEMASSGLYSNKIFYFEQDFDGRFVQPQDQPDDALLMITNHDVSVLSEWWSGVDLERRNELGLFSAELFELEISKRAQDRLALLEWLAANQTLPSNWSTENDGRLFDFDLCKAIHQTCARSNAKLLSLQIEDLQVDIAPINIPGTSGEYPNWQRKQSATTRDILNSSVAAEVTHAVNEERK
jgi:4-alpha-glucanotransferase